MRNAEASKEKILDAAFAEFAARGVAGARMDRIAAAAGCNKNLIYIYFQSKEALFATVLERHLADAYETIPFDAADLPAYVAGVFDFAMAHPELMRLMHWFSLEQETVALPRRSASRDIKLAAIAQAQAGDALDRRFSPGFLLVVLMALATAWSAASLFAGLVPETRSEPKATREQLMRLVAKLAGA